MRGLLPWPTWMGLAALGVVVAACATIIHGSSQEISVASQPPGAAVTIDGVFTGRTPVIADLKRKDRHMVVISLDGYEPFELSTTRGTSGWIAGNIIFGGLIGLAVDFITGAAYNVRPEQVSASLRAAGDLTLTEDQIFIVLVPRAEPGWQQIGRLERIAP